MRWAAFVLAALVLAGCETTAEKSAKLEKVAKAHAGALHVQAARLAITHESTKIKVSGASVLHSAEGSAAVVTLHNLSATPLREVPIQIDVRNASGASIYTNDAAGLAPALVSAPLIGAHGTLTWIDDQVHAAGTPASVSARVGEGVLTSAAIPSLAVQGAHLVNEATSGLEVEGSVVNHSQISQRNLVVYAVARRAGAIVAAGRAVLALAPAGSAAHFQVFFIGDPSGAQLQLSAPATTFG